MAHEPTFSGIPNLLNSSTLQEEGVFKSPMERKIKECVHGGSGLPAPTMATEMLSRDIGVLVYKEAESYYIGPVFIWKI